MESFEPAHYPLRIQPGATLGKTYRYGSPTRVYKTITGVPQRAPCQLTVPGHTVPDGWPVHISDVQGMPELNRGEPNKPQPCDFYTATKVDDDTLELNTVNATPFGNYRTGGTLMFFTPVDLTGMTATAVFVDASGKQVLEVTNTNGGVVITPASFTIVLVLTDAQTLALPKQGSYRLDLTTSGGEKIRLAVGSFSSEC